MRPEPRARAHGARAPARTGAVGLEQLGGARGLAQQLVGRRPGPGGSGGGGHGRQPRSPVAGAHGDKPARQGRRKRLRQRRCRRGRRGHVHVWSLGSWFFFCCDRPLQKAGCVDQTAAGSVDMLRQDPLFGVGALSK
jgi:hypothetical protein